MPKKIRELKSILQKAGFIRKSGKGSQTKWSHPLITNIFVISGNDGDDAKPYQEKLVQKALKQIKGKDL